jgi:Mycothiol maleylpyruvate isomerase N-terminal domain
VPDDALADASLSALRESVDRLHGLVAPMDDRQLEVRAYPKEWRVADVLSHIGSAEVIMHERFARGLRGESLPDDGGAPDLTLPAEALIRLVYGRLDPDHTPPVEGDLALLDSLRSVFPGP